MTDSNLDLSQKYLKKLKPIIPDGSEYVMSEEMHICLGRIQNPPFLKKGIAKFSLDALFGKEDYTEVASELYLESKRRLGLSPNSMHKYGASDLLSSELFDRIMQNIGHFLRVYFGIEDTERLVLFKDFTVHYGARLDRKLNIHRDDSDVTINICLKNTLNSTGLKFYGTSSTLFSTNSNSTETGVDLEQFDVIIHRGSHPHEVVDQTIDNGERVNLILWIKAINSN